MSALQRCRDAAVLVRLIWREFRKPPCRGRDLRMVLVVRATAEGDELLSRLIAEAVIENSAGNMYLGKACLLFGADNSTACVTLAAFRQTYLDAS